MVGFFMFHGPWAMTTARTGTVLMNMLERLLETTDIDAVDAGDVWAWDCYMLDVDGLSQ